ncbi:MAG: hypothetical protein J3Q66DRAFT_414455 [Benniella sp.]|nr:MAG: hypothetical protein J3Q66DRAFT_414455 [Benniella sp.]
MLHIPELDQMVCLQLSPHDLAQCAQVCKKWWSIVTPHIWGDLSWLCSTTGPHEQLGAFYKMVLEDYYNRDGQRKSQRAKRNTKQPSPRSPILSKYGHMIRTLPGPGDPSDDWSTLRRGVTRRQKVLEAAELFIHLINHCSPDVQVSLLTVYFEDMAPSAHHPRRTVLGLTLPRVRHLSIAVDCYSRNLKTSTLVALLDQCSTILERLEINAVAVYKDEMDRQVEERAESEPKCFLSLKELILHECVNMYDSDTKAFWPWLWKRCGRVEKIVVDSFPETAQSLAQSMLAYMPNLSEITLGKYWVITESIPDDMNATLLSGSRNGWKVVRVGPHACFERTAMNALTTHFSTLGVVEIRGSDDLIEVLRSCTNLHTLAITDVDLKEGHEQFPFSAEAFIDPCHDTASLKAWDCEASLRVLKISITGIPRQDRQDQQNRRVKSIFIGQGREMQKRVYERLARLVNLETLSLGSTHRNWLGTSLGSGLEKLSGLKKMKEFDVGAMEILQLGAKEARWMAEQWPRVRTLGRFCRTADMEEAVVWLRMHYPNIKMRLW